MDRDRFVVTTPSHTLTALASCFNVICVCAGSIREENGVRWHGCPYCSKEFKKPSDLVRHIRIHTHEKPFKCKQCFRAFAVKSTLTAHMKTHTGVKAFECQSCLKCFSTSGSMKVHMRLHTGEVHVHFKTEGDTWSKMHHVAQTFFFCLLCLSSHDAMSVDLVNMLHRRYMR